ncbi:MAG: hypothetical protein IKP09_06225 [Lentisphaeria bacterium]|nr:hypothetical protein [Lentisphaeria bacterium]
MPAVQKTALSNLRSGDRVFGCFGSVIMNKPERSGGGGKPFCRSLRAEGSLIKKKCQSNLHPANRFSTVQFKEQLFFCFFSGKARHIPRDKHISPQQKAVFQAPGSRHMTSQEGGAVSPDEWLFGGQAGRTTQEDPGAVIRRQPQKTDRDRPGCGKPPGRSELK